MVDFTAMPEHVEIMPSAAKEWARYQGQGSEADAIERAMHTHLEHTRAAQLPENTSGGIMLSDIPGYNLTVVDVLMGGERAVHIFARSAARAMWKMIEAIGKTSGQVH